MKKETKVELPVEKLIKTNPSDWLQVENPEISKIGDWQVRFAYKGGKFYCYNNYDYETKKIKSRFFADETNGREEYRPVKRIKYRADGTISSITIYNGDSKTLYCFDKLGIKTFKKIEE